MSYNYLLVSLKYSIESFNELKKENIVPLNLSVKEIKNKIHNILPEITWSAEDEDTIFGCTPCKAEKMLEVWIINKPFFSVNISAEVDDVVKIASRLTMTAIDVQLGNIVYSAMESKGQTP